MYNAQHGKTIKEAIKKALTASDLLTDSNIQTLSRIALKVAKQDRVSLYWMLDSEDNLNGYANSLVKHCL